MDEQVIKKEDGLRFGGGFFSRAKKGALVLTTDTLSFIQKGKGAKLFIIPIKNILNARSEFFSGRGDTLSLLYTDAGMEKKVEVQHRNQIGIMRIAAMYREPYFKSWEKLIDERRLGREVR